MAKPPLRIDPTTLWEYPSQHYDSTSGATEQGDRDYVGATPSWIIWQLLQRYTTPKDLVVDPMCGSGTTLDVARDIERRALGYDLNPQRPGIFRADARSLPLENDVADFVFIDPPYSTHVDYSDDPRCIGKLDAGGDDNGRAYFEAMSAVIEEIERVMRPDRCMALYVSDSYRKGSGDHARSPRGRFMPIGFELFHRLRRRFEPVDAIAVVRHNRKLDQGNFRRAAEEENFFLRGFNHLFIMRKRSRAEARELEREREQKRARRDERRKGGPRTDRGPRSGFGNRSMSGSGGRSGSTPPAPGEAPRRESGGKDGDRPRRSQMQKGFRNPRRGPRKPKD